jgi:hypothetical protein
MAVRRFTASSQDALVLGGTGAAVANGGYSIVALVKPVSPLAAGAFVALLSGGVQVGSLQGVGDGRLALDTNTLDVRGSVGLVAGAWQFIRVSHPAGTSTPRFSCKQLGTGSWTHVGAGTTHPDVAGVVDQVIIGAGAANGGFAQDAEIAWAALLPDLADVDVEAIEAELSSQFLYDLGAVDLWNLNQAATTTAVADLAGPAAQSSVKGTSVVTGDDPPGWDFTVTVPPPLNFSYRLSGGSGNTAPSASLGGGVSSTQAGVHLFGDLSNSVRIAGDLEYRLVYVHNDDTADGQVTAYVPTQLESGRELAIGAPTEAAGATVAAIASRTTAPSGVTFSAPSSAGGGVNLGVIPAGSFRGLWVRLTVTSNTPEDPTNLATIRIDRTRIA